MLSTAQHPTLNLSCSELASCSGVKNQSTCWTVRERTPWSTAGMLAGAAAGKGGGYGMASTLRAGVSGSCVPHRGTVGWWAMRDVPPSILNSRRANAGDSASTRRTARLPSPPPRDVHAVAGFGKRTQAGPRSPAHLDQ